jgi:hypothetical protein
MPAIIKGRPGALAGSVSELHDRDHGGDDHQHHDRDLHPDPEGVQASEG